MKIKRNGLEHTLLLNPNNVPPGTWFETDHGLHLAIRWTHVGDDLPSVLEAFRFEEGFNPMIISYEENEVMYSEVVDGDLTISYEVRS